MTADSAVGDPHRRALLALVGLGFLLLGLLLYAPALQAYFVADDFVLLRAVREQGPLGIWTKHSFGWLRPVASLSVYIDYRFWGLSPFGFHLTNVLLHVLCALLVAGIAARLIEPTELDPSTVGWTALLAGLLFLTLPSHAESVAWISGRTDLIAALFSFGAFLCYLRFKHVPRRRDAILSVATFGVALLAKEAALALPLVVGAYELLDRWLDRGSWRRSSPATGLVIALFALVPLYLLLRRVMTGDLVAGYGPGVHLGPLYNPRVLVWLPIYWVRALWPCCWPADALPVSMGLAERITAMRAFYLGLALLAGAIFGVLFWCGIWRARRIDRAGALLLWLPLAFCLAALPAVGIGMNVESSIGERFTYLPSAFATIFVALCLALLARAPRWRTAAAVGLLIVYSLALPRASMRWREAGDLARDILASVEATAVAEPLVVVTLPDNLRGALVFRNGFADALVLAGKVADPAMVHVLSHVTLHGIDDQVVVERSGDRPGLRLASEWGVFIPGDLASSLRSGTGVAPTGTAEDRLELDLARLEEGWLDGTARILYYSDGRLLQLPDD